MRTVEPRDDGIRKLRGRAVEDHFAAGKTDDPVGDFDDAAASRIYGFHDTAAQAPEEVQAGNPMPLCTSFMTQGVFS